MASEADTRHGPLGILLAQARAEKITCKPRLNQHDTNSPPTTHSPGAPPPRTRVPGGEAAVGSRGAPVQRGPTPMYFRKLN